MDAVKVNKDALRLLRLHKASLTRQQFKTLKGQILAGDDTGAMKGLHKLLNQKEAPKKMRLNYIDNTDCLEGLQKVPDNSIDLILTDPPYSSGEAFSGDRRSRTGTKYADGDYNGAARLPDFSGDNMDQRGFTEFCRQIFAKCRQKTKPEGVIACFIDWRNLPALTDAIQAAGWVWRGIAVWNKPNGRPQKGRFRSEFEYIVWGSNGPMPFDRGVGCLPGYYRYNNVQSKDRVHQTEKPLQLIMDLLEIVPEGSTVCDPFMGSGTTAVACLKTSRNYIGFELSPEYHATAQQRIADTLDEMLEEEGAEANA